MNATTTYNNNNSSRSGSSKNDVGSNNSKTSNITMILILSMYLYIIALWTATTLASFIYTWSLLPTQFYCDFTLTRPPCYLLNITGNSYFDSSNLCLRMTWIP